MHGAGRVKRHPHRMVKHFKQLVCSDHFALEIKQLKKLS